MKNIFILLIILFPVLNGYSQNVPIHYSQTGIYDFIDELANYKVN